MTEAIGTYKTKEQMTLHLGITAFRLPANSTVRITQIDKEYRKVLLHVDDYCDWVSDSILSKLEGKP